MMGRVPRIALVFAAMVFGVPVPRGLFAPEPLANSLGLSATGVLTGTMSSGPSMAASPAASRLFFVLASLRPAWHAPGLVAQLCLFGGLVVARVASIAAEGSPGALVYGMIAVEAGGGASVFVGRRAMCTASPGRTNQDRAHP